jgi:hypothetical protein
MHSEKHPVQHSEIPEGKQYPSSIINDDIFFRSREAISSKCHELKSKGKGNRPQRKRAPTPNEVHLIWEKEALGCSSPRTLQHTLWWNLCTRLGKRANKENHDMKWGDITKMLLTNLKRNLCLVLSVARHLMRLSDPELYSGK